MPYIKQTDRVRLYVGEVGAHIKTEGELNYCITELCLYYLQHPTEQLTYSKINSVIGVLECAKLELYRRLAVPYENKKIVENGDVY